MCFSPNPTPPNPSTKQYVWVRGFYLIALDHSRVVVLCFISFCILQMLLRGDDEQFIFQRNHSNASTTVEGKQKYTMTRNNMSSDFCEASHFFLWSRLKSEFFGLTTLLEPQSRSGGKTLKPQVFCPQNGTAVLKSVKRAPNSCIQGEVDFFVFVFVFRARMALVLTFSLLQT